jgi:hypothetical protein
MKDYSRWFCVMSFILVIALIMSVWMHTSHKVDKRAGITINVVIPDSFYDDLDEGVLTDTKKDKDHVREN